MSKISKKSSIYKNYIQQENIKYMKYSAVNKEQTTQICTK